MNDVCNWSPGQKVAGLPSAPPAVSSDVLAAGSPPLTRNLADNYAGFVMWLLDAPLTELQQQADFDDWARGLASTYPSYTQEQQQHERDQ